MILINQANDLEVQAGELFLARDGVLYQVTDSIGRPPHKPSSTGRMHVQAVTDGDPWTQEFFPTVFGCKWVPDDYLEDE